MARITIDVTSAYSQGAGIGRLTRETVRALQFAQHDHQVSLYCMGADNQRNDNLGLAPRHGPLSDRWLHRIWFKAGLAIPIECFGAPRADLFHATDFVLPPLLIGTKTVLTVHDLTFERDPSSAVPTLLGFLKRVVPASVRRANHVVADSHATARDLIELYAVPADKITTIHCGVDAQFSPVPATLDEATAIRARYKLPAGPYFLAVGTLQRRKNHLTLVRAFARALPTLAADSQLVLAGGRGWLYEDVLREVAALGIQGRIHFIGFVDDGDLPALYRQARVFCFPSLYEGFGIPLLEAMACGTPIVSSNTSSLPEVLGNLGLQHEPLAIEAWAQAMHQAAADEAWRAQQTEAGMTRAGTFTWQRASARLLDVYNRVLS